MGRANYVDGGTRGHLDEQAAVSDCCMSKFFVVGKIQKRSKDQSRNQQSAIVQ